METFYSLLIGMITCLIGILITFIKSHTNKSLKIFRYYFIGYTILAMLIFFRDFNLVFESSFQAISIVNLYDIFFTIFEFFVFADYIGNFISKRAYLFSKYFFVVGLIVFIIKFDIKQVFIGQSYLFSLQAISLLFLSFFYYQRIMKNVSSSLSQESNFWIITGISFFMLTTLPFSLIIDYIYFNHFDLYFLHFNIFYISYALLFIMIIKAFLCPQTTTK